MKGKVETAGFSLDTILNFCSRSKGVCNAEHFTNQGLVKTAEH